MPPPLGLVKVLHQCPSPSAGMTFNSSLLLLPDSDHLRRKVAMVISYSAQPKNPGFCILLNAPFQGPYVRRSKARGCLHSLRPRAWSPGASPPASSSLPLHQAQEDFLFFFFPRSGRSSGFQAISIAMKTLLCKMSISLFEGIFHSSNLNCTVKCQEWMFNEDQLEALIGWVFNGFFFIFF